MCTKIVIAGSIAGVGLLLAALGGGLGWGLFPALIEDQIAQVHMLQLKVLFLFIIYNIVSIDSSFAVQKNRQFFTNNKLFFFIYPEDIKIKFRFNYVKCIVLCNNYAVQHSNFQKCNKLLIYNHPYIEIVLDPVMT